MKYLRIILIICILSVMAFGSLNPSKEEGNNHNSFLGAIEYNEYGNVVSDVHKNKLQIGIFVGTVLLIIFYSCSTQATKILPKVIFYPLIRILKLKEIIIPKIFSSWLFEPLFFITSQMRKKEEEFYWRPFNKRLKFSTIS